MSGDQDYTFQIDASNFVLQRMKDEIDSLRAVTQELASRLHDPAAGMAAAYQGGIQQEMGSLKAAMRGLARQVQREVSALRTMTAGMGQQLGREGAALRSLAAGLEERLLGELQHLRERTARLQPNKVAMLCFSGDLDRILAAFILANGAAALGMQVMIFFSFWGCTALRKPKARVKGKDIFGKMFGFMLPKGADRIKLSKMHMGGMGTGMMKFLMKKKGVDSLPEMIRTAEELGVQIYVCEMSMEIMGMKRQEIMDYRGLAFAGAGTFLKEAAGAEITLFI